MDCLYLRGKRTSSAGSTPLWAAVAFAVFIVELIKIAPDAILSGKEELPRILLGLTGWQQVLALDAGPRKRINPEKKGGGLVKYGLGAWVWVWVGLADCRLRSIDKQYTYICSFDETSILKYCFVFEVYPLLLMLCEERGVSSYVI